MNVNQRNELFLKENIDREDLWPKVLEYENQAMVFQFQIGLGELPVEPGILLIRGPRQFGKSTWLELQLKRTLEKFGKGTAFFLNGDYIKDGDEFERELAILESMFPEKRKVKRIFIDEVTSIPNWEIILKRRIDSGYLRDVLIVTTGSKATDLRRGAERLPGRKGKLDRTDYVLFGVSYKDFHTQCHRKLGDDTWIAYLISGGSPIACKEIWQFGKVPEYFFEITRDWILGELIKTGRNRIFLIPLLRAIDKYGGTPVGFAKLARETGVANNTVASEYVEQLADLLCVLPSFQWDSDRQIPLSRKPCKFHFTNLAVANAFSGFQLRTVEDFKSLPAADKGRLLGWLVAQELYRRAMLRGERNPEALYFWKSKNHEIDFVSEWDNRAFEVKLGRSSALEFAWFEKSLPGKKLFVICGTPFQNERIKSISIDQFLLADGFPHPYPGMVEDVNLYNDILD